METSGTDLRWRVSRQRLEVTGNLDAITSNSVPPENEAEVPAIYLWRWLKLCRDLVVPISFETTGRQITLYIYGHNPDHSFIPARHEIHVKKRLCRNLVPALEENSMSSLKHILVMLFILRSYETNEYTHCVSELQSQLPLYIREVRSHLAC